ncbi:hypothetical protein [Thalassoroseus pseudoceratinae]|uniref:hypothetical protein n=1 Tax=Thalassoroseus pseudoceratinae TaxID=2713176 RepID=UPI001420E4D3|nr:hypothetical protein [Thalassoroseus pseudoceratinae]
MREILWSFLIVTVASGALSAQQKSSVTALDAKAKKAVESFSREIFVIAKEYEDEGELEKAKSILETLSEVHPDLKGLKEKIKSLDEEILSSNDFEIGWTPASVWKTPVARVAKGKTFRVQVAGAYRMSANLNMTANGIPQGKSIDSALNAAPFGSLVGVIMPLDKKKAKNTEPFPIGDGKDINPKTSGFLYIRVNLPPGSRPTGKLDLKFSGYVLKLNG